MQVTSRSRLTWDERSPVGRLLYGGRLQCAVGLISYTDEGIVLVEGVGGDFIYSPEPGSLDFKSPGNLRA